MLATSSPPPLTLIQGRSPKGRMEAGIHSEFTVGEFAQQNQDKLDALERKREELSIAAGLVGFAGITAMLLLTPFAGVITASPPISLLLGNLQTVSQRFLIMQELIKEFEEEDVAIEVGLKPDGLREIDFFLRFPDKE